MKKLVVLLMGALLVVCAWAQEEVVTYDAPQQAVVEFSRLAIRSAADYEVALETEYLMGTVLTLTAEDRHWREAEGTAPAYKGWAEGLGLVPMSAEELADYESAPKYICISESTHIYTQPSLASAYLSDFLLGDIVRQALNWSGKPYAKGKFFQILMPSGRIGYVLKNDVQDLNQWRQTIHANDRTPSAKIEAVIGTALRFVGQPYVWGGTAFGGVDCSGLTWNAFHMNGIELPRNTSQQVKCGTEIPLEEIRRGDLIFFGRPATEERAEGVSHVAIYLGDGRIVHSSQAVRVSSLLPEDSDYYEHRPILHVRRIIQ